MAKDTFPTLADLHGLMSHARGTVLRMRDDLLFGCRPDLAAAMALTALETWRLGWRPKRSIDPVELEKMRMVDALVVAIHAYESPELAEHLGAEDCAAKREQWTQILVKLTGP